VTSAGVAFEKAAAADRAALIGYLPAGFPSVDGAIEAAISIAEAGADVIEIGLPYSDPLMDGPVIQDAVHRALTQGVRVADVLRTVSEVAATGVPTLIMTYWNPIDSYGVPRFAADLAKAGGSGLITPDLTPEEAGPWLIAAREHDLDPVFLVAPSSSSQRIKLITSVCGGFVYAASTMGITGTRAEVSGQAEGLVSRVREHTSLPVAVGLGVSSGGQAAQLAGFADGVIVGSAFVQRLISSRDLAGGIAAVRELAAELADGVAHGSRGRPPLGR
jgi:tryptophan synthase alpha chain